MAQWTVEELDDWMQVTLEDPVQLTGVIVSGLRPSHTVTFSLKYGFWTGCLTAYTEGDGVKIFEASSHGTGKAEHYLASAVQAKVLRVTPHSWPGRTVWKVGLLGCPMKGPWSLQPCSLIEKEFICEKDPSSYRGDGCESATNYNNTGLEQTGRNDLNEYIPDMTVCDDCMASKTTCGNIRCGIPDQYRCGLIYSPGYPHAFPSSAICLWTIEGPRGSYVTLVLLDVDLPGYSGGACTSRVLQVRDRFLTVEWHTIHGLCRGEGEQKRYVSSSNEMRLAMLATGHNADFGDSRGFMATFNVSTFSTSRQVQNLPDDAGFICPCGWHLFRRNCYLTVRHHVPVNWEESDAKCREFGANLTSVADRAEMEFLHLLLVTNIVVKRITDPMLFIGLYDIHLNRTFVWTDGTPVTYMDWSPMDTRTWFPQPDGADINFCVAIVMKNVWGTDQWYDVSCDERATRSFICKRAAERVTRPGDNA